jgi:hypothetical protein
MDFLNLREKLDSLTNEDIYYMLIQMNFPETVAQFFKDKMNGGVKSFLFNELQNNPIQDIYLNVVLIKLLNQIRGKDTSNMKFPYNLKDPVCYFIFLNKFYYKLIYFV